MRGLALVVLMSLAADARTGRFERTNSRTPQGRSERGFLGDSLAFLEFAPASGAGMGAVCACTTPTGAKGEALTFTRGSSATCTKTSSGGLATTGIANGDLVTCSSNQPRVEYDSAGTLGLLVESARTNVCLRSEEFDNAAWTLWGVGAAAPGAPTANSATSPAGTLTADTVTFNATTGGQTSAIYMTAAAGTYTDSVYVKGVSGSGTLDLCWTTGTCPGTCSYNSTTWTRCVYSMPLSTVFMIGNYGTRPQQSVYLWGAQMEAGAYATSYMATGAAAANRLAESATFSTSVSLWPLSIAASINVGAQLSGSYLVLSGAGGSGSLAATSATATRCLFSDSVNTPFADKAGASVSGTYRAWCSPNGATAMTGSWGGSAMTFGGGAAMTTPRTMTSVLLASTPSDSIISRVCVDPSPTRCR